MPGKITIITPSGLKVTRDVLEVPTLEEFQRDTGGPLQMVPDFNTFEGKSAVVFCDEEGKMKTKPMNGAATMLWHIQLPYDSDDVLVGNVVIVQGDDSFMESL